MSNTNGNDANDIRSLLLGSGYSEKAINYFIEKKNMGSLPDADQVSELTGTCGDTMKVYLKVEDGRIKDAKIQVLGCPGAVASAMAAMAQLDCGACGVAAQIRSGGARCAGTSQADAFFAESRV